MVPLVVPVLLSHGPHQVAMQGLPGTAVRTRTCTITSEITKSSSSGRGKTLASMRIRNGVVTIDTSIATLDQQGRIIKKKAVPGLWEDLCRNSTHWSQAT